MNANAAPPSLRRRGQLVPAAVIGTIMLLTFLDAGFNIKPRPPTAAQVRAGELREIVQQRRERIAELLAAGDQCQPAIAHELARALVFDGRSARDFAERYETRCGADPVVHHWGNAPRAHR